MTPSRPYIQEILESDFEKMSGIVSRAGKGAWNLLLGGKTLPGGKSLLGKVKPDVWDPWHGLKQIGSVKQTHKAGPLKGMIKYDRHSGEPLYEKEKDIFKFLKQEFQGSKPTRADLFAHEKAKKMPVGNREFEQHLKDKNIEYKKGLLGGIKTDAERPTGVSVGEYMSRASRADRKAMAELNQMGAMQFAKTHPGLAANWYARQALHKGLFVGLPAYELYDTTVNQNPIHPGEGMGSNVGSSIGSALGMAAFAPLGFVGAPLASTVTQAMGRRTGQLLDRKIGSRPMYPRPEPIEPPALPPSPG